MKIRLILVCILALPILTVSAFSETRTNYSQVNRQYYIPFADPFNNLEANALTYLTLTELTGYLTDYLNARFYLDDSPYGRIAQIVFELYSICLWGYLSHEKAHAMLENKYGPYSSRLDFGDWSLGVPRYNSEIFYYPTSQQLIGIVAVGLNQESYLAYRINQSTPRKLSFDRAISFLIREFSLAAYDIYSSGQIDVTERGDLGIYSAELKKNGIDLSEQSISLQAAICGLLSVKTWDSLNSIYSYSRYGRRLTNSTIIRFRGQEITPPLVQYVLTERGGFINLTSTWLNKNMDISFGTDLGSWTGDVNNIRAGLKMNQLISLGPVDISPFAYINSKRTKLEYNGSLFGLEIDWRINKYIGLNARIAYSDDDIYEKTRGNEKGIFASSFIYFYF